MPLTLSDASTPIDRDLYLARIGHDGGVSVTEDTLIALHRAHAETIPFENLDIHLGRPIRNDLGSVFQKLVTQRRGGYCFEQNGLFAALLARFGFGVRAALARVTFGSAVPRIRGHLVTLVNLGGAIWVADVGFGGHGLLEPLRLLPDQEQHQGGETYKITPSQGGFEVTLQTREGWHSLYWFDMTACHPVDVELVNFYHSHSPDSFFHQHRVVARTRRQERLFLTNNELRTDWAGVTQTREIASRAEYLAVLAGQFDIDLPDAHLLKAWRPV